MKWDVKSAAGRQDVSHMSVHVLCVYSWRNTSEQKISLSIFRLKIHYGFMAAIMMDTKANRCETLIWSRIELNRTTKERNKKAKLDTVAIW